MAVQYRSGNSVAQTGNPSSHVIPKPAGLTVGDVMVAKLTCGTAGVTWTSPGGAWSSLWPAGGSGMSAAGFYKVADSGDVAATDFTFTASSGVNFAAGIIAIYDDAGGTVTLDVADQQDTSSGTSHAAPSVTTTQANTLLVTGHALDNGAGSANSWTADGAMDERVDVSLAGNSASVLLATQAVAGTGATGTRTATSTQSASGRCGAAAFYAIPAADPVGQLVSGKLINGGILRGRLVG